MGRDTGAAGRFPTTHWSLVDEAARGTGEAKARALAALLERYLPAMRAHLAARQWARRLSVEDVLQQFLADKVLGQDLVARAERTRGRFRAFLVTALENFARNQIRHDSAATRSPGPEGHVAVRDDLDAAGPGADPSGEFDVAWARQVLAQAIDSMRCECRVSGMPHVWAVFEGRVLRPTLQQAEEVPYERLVREQGLDSPMQAANALVTARRMFQRQLRAVVGRYEKTDQEVEDEIRDLWLILSRSRGARPV